MAPEGRKVGSLKRRVRTQLARGEMKNCTLLWREAHFQGKMYKAHHVRTTVEVFRRQNAQNTPLSDHFWKLRCRKSARRCGAKHISKSKCTKHQGFGPLLEVRMSKKCTPLWREAHFEVNMSKTPGVRTTFGGSDIASLRFTEQHYITLHYIPLHYTTLHYATLYSTTLQLQLHNYTTTLHYAPLHSRPHPVACFLCSALMFPSPLRSVLSTLLFSALLCSALLHSLLSCCKLYTGH